MHSPILKLWIGSQIAKSCKFKLKITRRYTVAKATLFALFSMITMLQIFSFPGQFAHIRRVHGISRFTEIALTLSAGSLFVCGQVAIFALLKLVTYMEKSEFFSDSAFTWMNVFVTSTQVAISFPLIIFLIVAPQADDPGALVMLAAVTLFLVALSLVASLIRDQIQAKTQS